MRFLDFSSRCLFVYIRALEAKVGCLIWSAPLSQRPTYGRYYLRSWPLGGFNSNAEDYFDLGVPGGSCELAELQGLCI